MKPFTTPDMIRETRETGRSRLWILELLIFAAVFLVASQIQSLPMIVGMIAWILRDGSFIASAASLLQSGDIEGYMKLVTGMTTQMPSWLTLVTLFSTGLGTVTAILFCRWLQKRGARTMGFRRESWLREYAVGALVGIVLISAAAGIGRLSGAYRFVPVRFSVPTMLLYMLGYIVQGMSEETLCRGYLITSFARRYPVWLAVLVSSLVFAALHLANPGISLLAFVNLVLCGAVFALYILRRGNIWGACAIHSFWNFFQGNVFGINVSGTGNGLTASASPLVAVASDSRALWTGGAFGIEGGLAVTIVLTLALLALIFLVPDRADGRGERALPPTED